MVNPSPAAPFDRLPQISPLRRSSHLCPHLCGPGALSTSRGGGYRGKLASVRSWRGREQGSIQNQSQARPEKSIKPQISVQSGQSRWTFLEGYAREELESHPTLQWQCYWIWRGGAGESCSSKQNYVYTVLRVCLSGHAISALPFTLPLAVLALLNKTIQLEKAIASEDIGSWFKSTEKSSSSKSFRLELRDQLCIITLGNYVQLQIIYRGLSVSNCWKWFDQYNKI